MISVLAWVIAIAAWLVILLSGPALVALVAVPPLRRWWLRPLRRRRAARRARTLAMEQARRDARAAVLELDAYDEAPGP